MTRLRPLAYRKVKRVRQSLGFEAVRQVGSHVVFRHPDGRTTVVPNHAREEIQVGMILTILDDARVGRDEFLRLL